MGWIQQILGSDFGAGSALAAAFAWGIISVLVNPCHLASLPLIVGLIDRRGLCTNVRQAGGLAALFALGMFTVVAVLGVATVFLGRSLVHVCLVERIFAVFMILAGLHILGVIRIPLHYHFNPKDDNNRRGWGYYLIGVIWGAVLGPCSLAHFVPVFGLSMHFADSPWTSFGLIAVYGLGQMAVVTSAGLSAQRLHKLADWHLHAGWTQVVRIVCGILVIGAGLWMVLLGHEHGPGCEHDPAAHHEHGPGCVHEPLASEPAEHGANP